MAKKETKVTRVKAKDTDSKPVKEVSKEPKMSKYAAKVSGVNTKKKAKNPHQNYCVFWQNHSNLSVFLSLRLRNILQLLGKS